MSERSTTQLKIAWASLKKEQPNMRIREAAVQLKVSEAELLATGIGENTVRLSGAWEDLLKRFADLGYVMSLTRNNACVLEHKGIFDKINIFGKGDHRIGTVTGPIETRVFFKNWGYAFAHTMEQGDNLLKSIQVFDKSGEAITKVYLQPDSNHKAYQQLIEDFKASAQQATLNVRLPEILTYADKIDQKAFLQAWGNLQDTHDFFPLLQKYSVHRYHALEIAAGTFTDKLNNTAVTTILEQASKTALPIMIFAGNRGNLQIHQGTVSKVFPMLRGGQDWINVLDPAFNLHLRRDMIAHSWLVKKPTQDGMVTSVEIFGHDKEMIAQLFGLRKPGQAELTDWTNLVEGLKC